MELYIHIPFCVRKCHYCDFLSFPCGTVQTGGEGTAAQQCGADRMAAYTDALCRELELLENRYGRTCFDTAFIGGGTPSVMPTELMERILASADRLMAVRSADFEYTIECNPGTVDREKLELYRRHGINRISFGLQSTDDTELNTLGRIHSYEDFLSSYRMAVDAGFDNINVDLISAVPGQTLQSWQRTLKRVATLGPAHISAYSLIIEPGTGFWDMYGEDASEALPGILPLPDEDTERAMYAETARILGENGYKRNEISNYARPGRECRHNLGYWTGEEYLGAGLGASSYIRLPGEVCNMLRYKNTDAPEFYIRELTGQGCYEDAECDSDKPAGVVSDSASSVSAVSNSASSSGSVSGSAISSPTCASITCDEEIIDRAGQMEEYMILHLRLKRGADIAEFRDRFGTELLTRYGSVIAKYIDLGLMKNTDGHIYLTDEGLDVSNTVMADFCG